MMRSLVAAAGFAVARTNVDQHVADSASVGVLEHDGAVTSQRQHPIRIVIWREPAGKLKAGVEKYADSLLELRFRRTANNHQRHGRKPRREIRCPGGPDARRGRAPERAHPLMRKRGAEVATTQMGRLDAEDPSRAFGRGAQWTPTGS